jgi:tetratricopeptide (TPR) repeat protein
MGFRLYKSVGLGKGLRLNISKTGIGVSAGIPGLRYSVHSSGRRVRTVGLPGTGLYYRKDTYAGRRSGSSRTSARAGRAPVVQMYPRAGLFAPKDEKLFVKGVTAYMQGRFEEALAHLQEARRRDTAGRHIGEELFLGLTLIALGRPAEAIEPLRAVLAADEPVPDALMQRYGVGGTIQVGITSQITAEIPIGSVGVALMLAEVYQHLGMVQEAIELLESVGAIAPDPIFALSLADLYTEASSWEEVVRVTEGSSNVDDATCQLLALRANALYHLGLHDAAIEAAKAALRSRSRAPELLRYARYVRALAYEAAGRRSLARKDLERIYAEDARFLDVAQRLEAAAPPRPGRG